MSSRRVLLGLAIALAGCHAPSATPTAKRSTVAVQPSAAPSPRLEDRPPVTVTGGGSLSPVDPAPPTSATPRPVATNAPAVPLAASLSGTVLAPPGILSNNGSGILSNNGSGVISDNGAGVIANNGSGYHALSVTQTALAGAKVYVLDAQGRTIRGGDGKALMATTDAQGRYAFTGDLPTHNFLLAVELADGKGLWQAILPKDAPSPRKVDLDVISTLTTGYILGQYVAGQADQQATLDKLPAAAEADTRAKAGAAFDLAGDQVPDRFSADVTLPVVEGLRKRDPAFDAQMEVVKSLLIAAGQSDFGNGQAATKTRFGRLKTVLPLPDGSFWLCSEDDGRIWSVDPAGTLHALAGTGVKGAAPAAGQAATAAALARPLGLTRDAAGKLVFIDGEKLFRVGDDGKLAVVCDRVARAEAVLPGGADTLWVPDFNGSAYRVVGPRAGTAFPPDFSASLPVGASPGRLQSAGSRADGGVCLVTGYSLSATDGYAVEGAGCILDAAGHAAAPPALPGHLLGVAQDGTWASLDLDGSLVFTSPDGKVLRCPAAQVAKLPAFGPFAQIKANHVDANGFWNVNFAFGNGKAYVFSMYEVHELSADGTVRHVAGLDPARVADGDANAVSLDTPTGLAPGTDGTLYLTDDALKQVLKRDLAGKITRFSGIGGWEISRLSRPSANKATLTYGSSPPIEFGVTYAAPAALARYSFPSLIRQDAKGQVMVLDMSSFLRRLEPNGDLKSVLDTGSGAAVADYLPQPDGTTLVALADAAGARVVRLAADGQQTVVVTVPGLKYNYSGIPLNLASGADGRVYVLASDTLYQVTAGALAPLHKDDRLLSTPDSGMGTVARLAVDATGRLYATIDDMLLRWAPGGSPLEVLAGPGGKLLNGTTADDSLQQPLSPAFGPGGDLYVVDRGNKQVKRLAAGQL
ncbi:MAG: hypothetical protein JWM80_6589 [Cyanobacteria bacterium RYN_339]|nr:hypothetical protein [Cyanobacteria bacterium RYN_339]